MNSTPDTRRSAAGSLLRCGLLFATCVLAVSPAGAQAVEVELVAAGLMNPVFATAAPDDVARVFIVEQAGRVLIVEDGSLLPAPFIDLTAEVASGGERGLLGLAFHPGYSANGRFFLSFTDLAGDLRVREYQTVPPDADVADPVFVQEIVHAPQPFAGHNGGCIAFAPDGKFYLGLGDGGDAFDPGNRAQDPTTNLGKLLRLDVDLPAPFVPPDNPFVGVAGVNDEIWALGLRNPWRWSFDRATGDLYIGDVGQSQREEIDFQPAASTGGENYGWRCQEGTNCTGLSGCTCGDIALTAPVHDYPHSLGCAVTGGYVYRGSGLPQFAGRYFFGDYCTSRIWSFRMVAGVATDLVDHTAELSDQVALISSFGEDASGELLIVDHTGSVYRLAPRGCQPPCRPAQPYDRTCGSTERYCDPAVPNSTGQGGRVDVYGSLEVPDDELILEATSLPPEGNLGYFVMGAGRNSIQPPGSVGPICVLPGLIRILPPVSNTTQLDGGFQRDVGTSGPQTMNITPGSTWNFQAWHRDIGAGTSNFTDALSVTFCP